jgi:hypothetical protein
MDAAWQNLGAAGHGPDQERIGAGMTACRGDNQIDFHA